MTAKRSDAIDRSIQTEQDTRDLRLKQPPTVVPTGSNPIVFQQSSSGLFTTSPTGVTVSGQLSTISFPNVRWGILDLSINVAVGVSLTLLGYWSPSDALWASHPEAGFTIPATGTRQSGSRDPVQLVQPIPTEHLAIHGPLMVSDANYYQVAARLTFIDRVI